MRENMQSVFGKENFKLCISGLTCLLALNFVFESMALLHLPLSLFSGHVKIPLCHLPVLLVQPGGEEAVHEFSVCGSTISPCTQPMVFLVFVKHFDISLYDSLNPHQQPLRLI